MNCGHIPDQPKAQVNRHKEMPAAFPRRISVENIDAFSGPDRTGVTMPYMEFAIPATRPAVAHARNRVVEELHTWVACLDDETTDAVRLVVSELVANAVVHAGGRT